MDLTATLVAATDCVWCSSMDLTATPVAATDRVWCSSMDLTATPVAATDCVCSLMDLTATALNRNVLQQLVHCSSDDVVNSSVLKFSDGRIFSASELTRIIQMCSNKPYGLALGFLLLVLFCFYFTFFSLLRVQLS